MAALSVELPERLDPAIDELRAQHPQYADFWTRGEVKASEAGFAAMERMDVVRKSGVDNEGHPVFMFIPGNIAEGADLDELTMFAVHLMHDVVVRQGREYTVLWVCNNLLDSRLSFAWFRRTYRMLPQAYHKQLCYVCVVHPDIQTRLILFLLSYFVKNQFWEKLFYADRIEFLDERLKDDTIASIPEEYKQYDRDLDKAMYATEDASLAQMQGMVGMPPPFNQDAHKLPGQG
ncbi:hypothetical protein AB1Y20_000993 [Prymnesium parvum]|uniref:CRAL-TRIO domain-containing protein n=1 Tax=Prymnesium parvum TaxID=97485 RepID=A0AB34KBB9_PRYPA